MNTNPSERAAAAPQGAAAAALYAAARRYPSVPLTQLHEAQQAAKDHLAAIDTERSRNISDTAAATTPCPRCDAPEGQPCLNLRERAKGHVVPTKHAHDERVAVLERVASPATRARFEALTERLAQARKQVTSAEADLTFAYAILRTRGSHPNLHPGSDDTFTPTELRHFREAARAPREAPTL